MTIAEDRPDEAAAAAEVEAAADDDAPVEIAAIAAVTPALVFRWAAAATLGVLAVLLASMAVYAVRDILVLVLIAVFVAVSLDPAVRWLVRRFPRSRRTQVADIVNVVVDKVGAYMIGNLIISVFAGVSSFICLTALRVPYALPLALWVAIADLIPMVGATLGASVCVLVA